MSGADSFAEQVRALVERSCAEQGVPVRVTDGSTVSRVVTLLKGTEAGTRAHARSASTEPAAAPSETPDWANALDGDRLSASGSGHDLHVLD